VCSNQISSFLAALKLGIDYALSFSQNHFSFNRWLKIQLNDFGGSQLPEC